LIGNSFPTPISISLFYDSSSDKKKNGSYNGGSETFADCLHDMPTMEESDAFGNNQKCLVFALTIICR